jgi:hypothetical protein
MKANWINQILRRKCLPKHVFEGNVEGRIEVTGRRGRRRNQILDVLKKTRGYWKLEDEALYGTLWRTRFGKSYRPVLRHTTEWVINKYTAICIKYNDFHPGNGDAAFSARYDLNFYILFR